MKTLLKTDLTPDNKYDNLIAVRRLVSRVPKAERVFLLWKDWSVGSSRCVSGIYGALEQGRCHREPRFCRLRPLPPRRQPGVPRCSRRPPAPSGAGSSSGWLRAAGPPRSAPGSARPAYPSHRRHRSAGFRVERSGAEDRPAAQQGSGAAGQPPGRSSPSSGGAAAPCAAPVPLVPKFPQAVGGRPEQERGRGAARGSRRGGRLRGYHGFPSGGARAASPAEDAAPAAAPTFQHRAEFVQGHCLPGGPRRRLRGGGGDDHRRSMAAAPREGAVAHGYGSAGPRPPAAMPGAPARGALSLRRPSPEPPPPPCSVPSRVGRGGLRRGRPAPGGGERRGGRWGGRETPRKAV